ncbi:MAG: hypothetical protein CMP49_03110 [Flavobacteriales bacterium]|nr:hypothetical protein [Flavobacteriales bacterium]|tara:strand:- start:6003 stop:6527 length:525 start_codon:yes stop_codon:yes gene_type:complete
MLNKQTLLVIFLIIIGVLTRVIPHLDNFTAVYAIAIFSGAYIDNKKIAFLLPLSIMFFSDYLLGFLPSIPTYISFIAIVWFGFSLKKNNKFLNILIGGTIASMIFFMITNFFVWLNSSPLDGIYYCSPTLNGLLKCYIQAIPFLWNTLFSTIIYTFILFYSYAFINIKLLSTSQ